MKPLESQVAAAWDPARWRDVTVLLAVSGGADSVALARAASSLHALGSGRLIVAHYNHALRGAESDADEAFVVELARRLKWECRVGRAAALSTEPPVAAPDDDKAISAGPSSSEEQSRAGRYDFLIAAAQECGARYVATAHTADDQAETVLHHMLRGTGLSGLSGMSSARELAPGIALVRPLLSVRRAEVLDYLAELGQAHREDSSNRDPGYTRNRLRHELLPRLAADYNPRVVEALLRLGAIAGEAQATIEGEASAVAARATIASSPRSVEIDVTALSGVPRGLVREALIALWRAQKWPFQAMGFEEWERLAALVTAPSVVDRPLKHVLPGAIHAERAGDRLTLTRGGDQ